MLAFSFKGSLVHLIQIVVRLPRFERGTYCLEGSCSIHLSYRRLIDKTKKPAKNKNKAHPPRR
jgi:hypothetical protein